MKGKKLYIVTATPIILFGVVGFFIEGFTGGLVSSSGAFMSIAMIFGLTDKVSADDGFRTAMSCMASFALTSAALSFLTMQDIPSTTRHSSPMVAFFLLWSSLLVNYVFLWWLLRDKD